MNEIQVIQCDVKTLDDSVLKDAYINCVPVIEKKCREVKKEVKERIKSNGELDRLKIYEENAGVDITDIEKFYGNYKEYIAKDEFIGECVKINMTAFKKLVVERIQDAKKEGGLAISKADIVASIDLFALECGKQKKKEVVM